MGIQTASERFFSKSEPYCHLIPFPPSLRILVPQTGCFGRRSTPACCRAVHCPQKLANPNLNSGFTTHRYYLWREQSRITDLLPASEPGLGFSTSITTRCWQGSEEGGRQRRHSKNLCIAPAAVEDCTGKPARKSIVHGLPCGNDAHARATRAMIDMAAEASRSASDGRRALRTSFEMSGQHRRHNIRWAGWTTMVPMRPDKSHGRP